MAHEDSHTDRTALGHLRVLEVGEEVGELCGKMLADLGADVLRVEPPGGVATRRIGPFFEDKPHPERSLHFWHHNTNKRSITLDLDQHNGRALFRRLLDRADVVVESTPPGYTDERGFSYDQVREAYPRLVYVSISAFGRGGPRGHMKGGDLVGWAASGYMYTTGWTWQPPTRPWGRQACYTGCLYAVTAAMAALFNRWRTDRGQHVDISLQEAVASVVEHDVPFYVGDNIISGRRDNDHVNGFGAIKLIPCKDGWAHLNIGWREGHNDFVDWLNEEGMADDLTDDKWKDDKYRRANIDHVVDVFSAWARTKTKAEIFEEGQKRKIANGPVNSIAEVFRDPQLQFRQYWVNVQHPELQREFVYPGAPYAFDEAPWSIRRRAPLIGEDNVAVYERELEYTRDEMTALAEQGVI